MGRKTHMLKLLVKENAQARESLLSMADSLKKVGLISEKLQVEGLKVGDKSAKIDKISIPTLTSILKEIGFQIAKGRPKSESKPIWMNMPQAVSAIRTLIDSVGIEAAVDHLNKEGISFGTTKITFKGDNTLSVATLSSVLGKETKTVKKEIEEPSSPVAKNEYDFDDEDEEEDEDEDEDDIEDEEDFDDEDEDEEDEEEDEDDEFLNDEEDDYEEDEDEEDEEDDDEDYDDEVSDF